METGDLVWFRRYGTFYLPLLSSVHHEFSLTIMPYLHELNHSVYCEVLVNGRIVFMDKLKSGWNTISFIALPRMPFHPVPNIITVRCDSEFSPYELGRSDDKRKLTAAIKSLEIKTLENPGLLPSQSHWTVKDSAFEILLSEKQCLINHGFEPIKITDEKGGEHVLYPSEPCRPEELSGLFVRFEGVLSPNKIVSVYHRAFQSAAKDMPYPVQSPILHLILFFNYLLTALVTAIYSLSTLTLR